MEVEMLVINYASYARKFPRGICTIMMKEATVFYTVAALFYRLLITVNLCEQVSIFMSRLC